MAEKHKILIISWGVFPLQQAMSVLVHNLAKELGHDSVVVVGEKSNVAANWDSVPYPLYYIDAEIFGISKGKEYLKWLLLFPTVNRIKEIVEAHNCTSILCPFPDEFYLAVSYLVTKETKLPFYPWFHNTYLENRNGIKKLIAKFLQPKVFEKAEVIFTISDGLTEYYASTYKSYEFCTLVHGFNIPKQIFKDFSIDISEKIRFAYTGSFNESCKDAAVRLCKAIVSDCKYELHVFGRSAALNLAQNGIPVESMVIYDFLSEFEFFEKLQFCHIMLLPHGFNGAWSQIEFDTIFPTRTIPLLFSNRPILLYSPENVFLTNFFKVNRCGFVESSRDEERILNTIREIITDEFKRNEVIFNALKISQKFDVRLVKQQLFEMLEIKSKT